MVAFRCYDPSGDGRKGFHAWYDEQDADIRTNLDSALELLGRDKSLEESRRFKALRGKCQGLTEIIIDFKIDEDDPKKAQKVHVRILGFGTADDFVLLYGFRKFGGLDYGPACHAAHNRMLGVSKDGRRALPCRFP